jgi:hypothetical protein
MQAGRLRRVLVAGRGGGGDRQGHGPPALGQDQFDVKVHLRAALDATAQPPGSTRRGTGLLQLLPDRSRLHSSSPMSSCQKTLLTWYFTGREVVLKGKLT